MARSFKLNPIAILSGEDKSAVATCIRVATRLAEPFYSAAMTVRNTLYHNGVFHAQILPAFTISVGNITTGGTGKTPVVRWLAEQLRNAGQSPAVLLRGYRSTRSGISDEQMVLQNGLNADGLKSIPVVANPNRIEGAATASKTQSGIDTFLLDDGFQHRKVRRDFDLVLISAMNPFGYQHVLPRGLLREPLAGLARASAFVITHVSQASADIVSDIERILKNQNPAAPIYHADHLHTGLRTPASGNREPMSTLANEKYFVFTGIGNPNAFYQQLSEQHGIAVGHTNFADHHDYSNAELADIYSQAVSLHADRIVTTEKDWVKIVALSPRFSPSPLLSVVELGISFRENEGDALLAEILAATAKK